jgi:hypothetical protein
MYQVFQPLEVMVTPLSMRIQECLQLQRCYAPVAASQNCPER